jgi:hypothetical protein
VTACRETQTADIEMLGAACSLHRTMLPDGLPRLEDEPWRAPYRFRLLGRFARVWMDFTKNDRASIFTRCFLI